MRESDPEPMTTWRDWGVAAGTLLGCALVRAWVDVSAGAMVLAGVVAIGVAFALLVRQADR